VRYLPRTISSTSPLSSNKRVPIRIPGTMMNEVDRIVRDHPELDYNRQQFVESAVREKIERIVVLASARANNSFIRVGDHLKPL